MSHVDVFDAVVVGGGPAGLSAALALGRARRRVLVAADGPTRNARAQTAHNVLTLDGTPPAEIIRIGREQLAPYDVTIRTDWASDAERLSSGFAVTFKDSERVHSRVIVLATGVRDLLPEIPGMAELWGTGVFHCPYCHGWEVAGRPLAIYARGEKALHLSKLIRGWTDDLTLLTDGPTELSDEDREQIERNGIVIREERVERLVANDADLTAIVLESGESIARSGLFVSPAQEQRSDLPHLLGCPIDANGRVEADVGGRTPVKGVFIAGDAGPGMQTVVSAMTSGTLAGMMLNHDLLEEEFEVGR